nr:MAG TPA: hypothetical protein [Bacteriophage sp.]
MCPNKLTFWLFIQNFIYFTIIYAQTISSLFLVSCARGGRSDSL